MSSLRSLCYTLSRSAIEPDYIDRWFELWNFLVPTNTTLRVNLNNGGERGIRTLDTLLTYIPLAGARLQPLGQLS